MLGRTFFPLFYIFVLLSLLICHAALAEPVGGDEKRAWNNPYPVDQDKANIFYSTFTERPKHLDPVRSYSANEYEFLGQIYEPLLQYHFLKRPYELVPLTAAKMPSVIYLDERDNELPSDASTEEIAWSIYRLELQPGIRFQPHPALAVDENGNYLYHSLTSEDLENTNKLSDFTHQGTREVTADDYVYQIKRMANPSTHSPIASLMMGHIHGLKELSTELVEARKSHKDEFFDLRKFPLGGVKVIDRYNFEIRLKGKYPQFIYWLSMYFFSPMPWEADLFYSQPGMDDKNLTLNWYPIGTGPYMLTENNPNLRMVMERNPNFHNEYYPGEGEPEDQETGLLLDAGKLLPFIDKAVYSLEKESIPAWNKFLQGFYDLSSISSDSFDQAIQFGSHGDINLAESMQEKDIELLTAVTTSTFYMGFNMLDDVVGTTGDDPERARKLRQAISIAVDYEEFISIFANGRGVPAQGPVPPGIFGHVEGEKGINPTAYEWKRGKPERKSLAEAEQLMVEAGYPNGRDTATGKQLILYFDTPAAGPGSKSMLNWLRKQYKKLGIQLVVRATDYNRFQEKMLKGNQQIFQWGWNADYPDPENFLFLLYGDNGKVKHKGENAANYDSPEFDRLFVKMKNMDNGPERQRVIDQMVTVARADAPWLWGYHPVAYALQHSWYKNAKPNLMANNTLKYKRINADERAVKRKQWNQPVLWPLKWLLGLLLLALMPAILIWWRKERASAL